MAAQVFSANLWYILDPISRRGCSPAKVHVFEPHRMKIFV
jgi:hypothetical protein